MLFMPNAIDPMVKQTCVSNFATENNIIYSF
jgi:hypothetical protein